jgi:hypothetical protein
MRSRGVGYLFLRSPPAKKKPWLILAYYLVAELYPSEKRDIKILQRFGLLTDKTVLAHCCHLYDEEVGEVVRAGAAITSCPYVI